MHETANRHHSGFFYLLLATIAGVLAMTNALAGKLKLKKLPDTLDRHGLVIVQLGPNVWDDATVELSTGRRSEAHAGFFVEKLKPGRYTLEQVTRLASTQLGSLGTTRLYASVPVNREFTIAAGKITHLGLLYFITEPGKPADDEKEVIVLPFRNAGPEQLYLQKYYPELAASVTPADVVVEEYEYSNDKLAMVRHIVFRLHAEDGIQLRASGNRFAGYGVKAPVMFSDSAWAFGDLGIAGRPEPDGKLRMLGSSVVDRLTQIGLLGDEGWFLSQAGGVYRAPGDSLVAVDSLPAGFLASAGFVLNDHTLVLLDNQFNLLVSPDWGANWYANRDFAAGHARALQIDVSLNRRNAYVIGRDDGVLRKQPRAIVIDRQSARITRFDIPARILKKTTAVFETDAGLFVQTENAGSSPTTLHFRRASTGEWSKNEVKNYFGCELSFPTAAGDRIEALCGFGRVNLVSHDHGETWQRVEVAIAQQN